MEFVFKRLVKVGAIVFDYARRRPVHEASPFPLAEHYRAVFG
jgi:hypothetical protein